MEKWDKGGFLTFLHTKVGRTEKSKVVIMETVEEKIKRLPDDLQKEVVDFVDFLLIKHKVKTDKKLSFQWVGGLKEYRDKYTSVELQEKASKWRD